MKTVIATLFLTIALFADSITIVTEKSFTPFLKEIEKTQKVSFSIHETNSSLEAFEQIKKDSKPMFAIVRGDILRDNLESKNFFEETAYQNFKIITKLDSEPTYLYFISKKNVKGDAYDALTPNRQTQKIKKISIGYLRDLSFIYLNDIAKSVNADYRFHYRAFEPEDSLRKLENGSLDACYMFVSKDLKKKIERLGFSLSKLKKPVNIDAKKFGEVFVDKKTFHELHNGIQVDNYLIASSSINETHLYPLVFALNESNSLKAVDPKFGETDSKVSNITQEIEKAKAEQEVEQALKDKECKESDLKYKEFRSRKVTLDFYGNNTLLKVKKLKTDVQQMPEYQYFIPRIQILLDDIKRVQNESKNLAKEAEQSKKACDIASSENKLNEVKYKIDDILRVPKELANLESEILRQTQLDEQELIRKIEEKQAIAEQEERRLEETLAAEKRRIEAQIEAQLQIEETKRKIEEGKGLFETVKKTLGL